MRKKKWAISGFVAATLIVAASCTDAGGALTGPGRVANQGSSLLGGLLNGVTSLLIAPLHRTTPLASDVSWSFTVGAAGGSSSNAATGLTIQVPAGALSAPTTITVTGLAGSPVAYKFEPHGLVFARNASLTQNLRGTNGGVLGLPLLLSGAHFATDRLQLNPDGLALVTEVVPAVSNLLSRTVTFGIGHFSGWIVASGRASEETSDGY